MILKLALLLALVSAGSQAQTLAQWDASGNAQLSGVYNFRQVAWYVANQRGDLQGALALSGTMTFSGSGSYTLNCQFLDSSSGRVQTCPAFTGAYRVSVGGIARISGPLGDVIECLLTNEVLVGSTTETDFNDLFVAAKAGDQAPTTAALNGRYWVGNFGIGPDGTAPNFRDSLFAANFDGAGGIESVQATGYIGVRGSTAITQSINGARYTFSSGVGTLAFGGTLSSTNLIAGSHTFFTSPDGSLFFGGAGWDMTIGIRAASGTVLPAVSGGLYYQAGLSSDQRFVAQNVTSFQTYYASFLSNGSFLAGHQRVQDLLTTDRTYDFTYTTPYTLATDGTYEDTKNATRAVVSPDGKFQLAIGKGPFIGLDLAVRADFTGTGVFVNPGLILNAASFSPSTAGVSRGELVTISGTGLATTSVVDGKFPTTLGGVTVLINGRAAPLLEVSPTRITAQVPFSTTELTATITVISNGQTSAAVMLYLRPATPGVFLVNGIYAAALHADFTLVSTQKPAVPGETIQVYVTGFGDVSPAVVAGTPAPVDPLSLISGTVFAVIDDKDATVQFKGLAPGLVGLYQLNIQVPAGLRSGDLELVTGTADGILSSALIPVAGQ